MVDRAQVLINLLGTSADAEKGVACETMAYHPTPDLPHFSSFKFDVYEPAEDSFLLMDALHKDLDFLMRMK